MHQSCVAHLLCRANEMIADSVAGQARVPHALRRLLLDALALRARRDAAQTGGQALEGAIAELESRLDKLLAAKVAHPQAARPPAQRARRPVQLPAPPGRARHQPRGRAGHPPAGVHAQELVGNKSGAGARAAAVLGSVLRTSAQQGANPIDVLVAIATSDGRRNGLDLDPGPEP